MKNFTDWFKSCFTTVVSNPQIIWLIRRRVKYVCRRTTWADISLAAKTRCRTLTYLWSGMSFSSLFLCVFLAACLTYLHLRDISLLILSTLPLNYVLWLFWFHFIICLGPILSISDWMLQSVSLTMDNCPICSKRVLPHAKQVKCCSCHLIYHMKCLTLQTENLLYIRNNSLTWFCKTCITELFPFNHIEHDDVFVSEVNNIGSCTRSIESLWPPV